MAPITPALGPDLQQPRPSLGTVLQAARLEDQAWRAMAAEITHLWEFVSVHKLHSPPTDYGQINTAARLLQVAASFYNPLRAQELEGAVAAPWQ